MIALLQHALLGVSVLALVAAGSQAAAALDGRGLERVIAAVALHGTLAGDGVEHPLILVPTRPDCGDLRRRADIGWVVIWTLRPAAVAGFEDLAGEVEAGIAAALACLADRSPAFRDRATAIYAPTEP